MPRDLVAAHADELARVYCASLDTLAACGGISVFELLMLLPPAEGTDQATHRRRICALTLNQAMQMKNEKLSAFHVKREADAEAAMLAMMEAESAGDPVP